MTDGCVVLLNKIMKSVGERDSVIPDNCLCRKGFGKQMMNLIIIEGHDLIKSCTLPLSRYFSVGHLLILKCYTDFKKSWCCNMIEQMKVVLQLTRFQ